MKAFMDSGALGKINHVRLNRYGQRDSIGNRSTPLPPPPTCDYNLWLGPAQDLPIYRDAFHYDWHWMWNTGNGELGNWGAHITDDARNLAFRDTVTLPRRVVAAGGRLGWRDAGETPNTQFLYMDTGSYPVIMDIHNLPRAKGVDAGDIYRKRRTGGFLVIECEGGYYAGGRGGGAVYDPDGKTIQKFKGDGGGNHARNFIDAVRSRNVEQLHADIEQAHFSCAWCLLGNASWRLGQPYSREEADERVKAYAPWSDVIDEFHAHLDANEIDPAREEIKIGAVLDLDPQQETFIGTSATPDALGLLRRSYRAGFEVPDAV
jgi:predicted dehydrogenase